MSPPVLIERHDGVAYVKLNRPGFANTIDRAMASGLLDAAIECTEDHEIRAVVLTGEGDFFCAGGDLTSITTSRAGVPRELRQITSLMHEAVIIFSKMPKPLLTGINGTAAGAGLSLALNCDYAVAAESAAFKVAFTAIGLTPDCGTTFVLPRLVGVRMAQRMILENTAFTAREAFDLGLISLVVPDAELAQAVAEAAARFKQSATRAVGGVRELLLGTFSASLEEQLAREADLLAGMGGSGDAVEGIRAFLDKRAPNFLGQ